MRPRIAIAFGLTAGALAGACTPDTELAGTQASAPQPSATVAPAGAGDAVPGAASDPLAGLLVEPPSGSADVPPNVAALVIRFTETVQATGAGPPFVLRPTSGDPVAVPLGEAIECAAACYRLVPSAALAPSTAYALEVPAGALQFLDGKPVPAVSAGTFTTASTGDVFAPRILASTLSLAEGCLTAQASADELVRSEITVSAGDRQVVLRHDTFVAKADFAVRMPELPGESPGNAGQATATLRVFDRAGNSAVAQPVVVSLPARLPALTITEVLANPAGSETTQELVEIYNRGATAEPLGGLVLADKVGSDTFPQVTLAAGAYAVVVPEGYLADTKDPPPREGTLVARVAGRLGGDGLGNSGEPVRLLSAQGEVISQYGGWVDVSSTTWSGKSVKRSSPLACDSPDAWSKSPSAPTPGW